VVLTGDAQGRVGGAAVSGERAVAEANCSEPNPGLYSSPKFDLNWGTI
jgi:hypothetical protein